MASQIKTVCIIGAGPSGLAAAKALTHLPSSVATSTKFKVAIFEKTDRIGGLWPSSLDEGREHDRLVNPMMRTNQSRHTVSFSDLAWPGPDEMGVEKHDQFPRAWEVGQYLERYREMYGTEWDVRLGCKVVKVEKAGDGWTIHVHGSEVKEELHYFDHVIVASGFFGAPRAPRDVTQCEDSAIPVWHSSRFRDIRSLITDSGTLGVTSKSGEAGRKKIVVVGGQMSGIEVAGNIALQLSDCVNAPGQDSINWQEWEVVHIVQRPLWIMPFFLPTKAQLDSPDTNEKIYNPAPDFLPCDLVTYDLASKPPGELQNTGSHIPIEAAEMINSWLNALLGSDQSELGSPQLAVKGPIRSEPVWVSNSDEYTEFVRSGNIKVMNGRIRSFDSLDQCRLSVQSNATNDDAQPEQEVSNVAAVVLATGFDNNQSVNFFQKDVLETLQFDPECEEFPLALNVNTVVSRKLPSLGFVGFYRSPYWGVIEMQARYLANLWSGEKRATTALAEDATMDDMLKLRRDPRKAQFPMGDYGFLMESFAKILGIKRLEPGTSQDTRTGLVSPLRYRYADLSKTEMAQNAAALETFNNAFVDAKMKGKFLARAVFRALQGDWKLEREIESFISTYPSGTFSATAKFLPRRPTENGYDSEHLYIESGEFSTSTGLKFSAKRRYSYRYASATDKLSAWFIKADDKTVDYFFHELEFTMPRPEEREGATGWKAKSFHLCTPDTYDVHYEFKFQGVQLKEWVMAYTVKGPHKDYKIRSVYTRHVIAT